jgi:hypothetical protein
MRGGPGWHAQLAGERVEWCEDLCERGTGSGVVLVAVPPGRGVTTALNHLAAAADGDDVPVTLVARISREEPQRDDHGVQAAAVINRLAKAAARHRIAEFLGLDRFGGMTQLGLGSPWTAGAVRCSWSQR